MPLEIRGVLPPIPTPFDNDGQILHAKLRSNIETLSRTGLHGFAVLGSNGEFVLLSDAEKAAVWETARAAIPQNQLFLAGAGAESTHTALALARRAAELGADAAMVVTPSYYRSQMTGPTLIHHYRVIADGSPIPIIVYNMPGSTGIDIDAATVIALAEHPNIIGIKDSSGNVAKFGNIVGAVRPEFSVIAGSGGYLYPALVVGAKAAIAAVANVAPRECVALYDAIIAGRHEEARALQLKLIPLNQAVTARWGVPGLKAALDLAGDIYGGNPRLPLRPLPDTDRAALKDIMHAAGLL
jgi:4-hydroxy-2-oxoglutarate aldolase